MSEEKSIVPVAPIIRTMDDAERAAKAMVASGFFQDSKQASQAVVKILAGQELGFGPFASMTGVNIIQNKPVLAANLMAAAVKRQGKYNYRIVELTDTGCVLAFFEAGIEVGRSEFKKSDAEKAGLLQKDNWKKYPRNMYFARAISNGQKWYAPDVFNGATVYTPDELGAQVDDEGNAVIIDADLQPEQTKEASIKDNPIQDAIKKYGYLCLRADAVQVPHDDLPENVTIDEARKIYAELLGFVKNAEAQAKSG